MKSVIAGIMACCALAAAAPAAAQPMMSEGVRWRPPFLENLFPPRLIMRFQNEISLTAEQRKTITEAMRQTEGRVVDLRWQFEAESQKLGKIMESERVDEETALAQAEKVMALEQRMKREHLGLLIRVKNQLASEQQEQLRKLRAQARGRGFRRGGPGPAPE